MAAIRLARASPGSTYLATLSTLGGCVLRAGRMARPRPYTLDSKETLAIGLHSLLCHCQGRGGGCSGDASPGPADLRLFPAASAPVGVTVLPPYCWAPSSGGCSPRVAPSARIA